jgi:signal peptidase I
MRDNHIIKEIIDWVIHIALAIVIGLFIVTFVAQRTIVDGNSMLPTLSHDDQLIVEKITPRLDKLKRGDLVTIYIPEHLEDGKDYVVKRIIAIGNDKVEIKDGKIYVNGEELKEDYINGNNTEEINPEYSSLTVPSDCVYVLGDNRLPYASLDSRTIGPIKKKKVIGKVIFRYYPFARAGKV